MQKEMQNRSLCDALEWEDGKVVLTGLEVRARGVFSSCDDGVNEGGSEIGAASSILFGAGNQELCQ